MSNTSAVAGIKSVTLSYTKMMEEFDSLPYEYRELLRYSEINGYLDPDKVKSYEYKRVS